MSYSEYYMSLPLDLAGSRTKNRFRIELLWGISKLIDSYKEYDDFTVVFDFKCDIELHYENGLDFYQVKTKNRGNHNYNSLTSRKENASSILGKLYALYNPNEKIKLALVCNKHFKIGRQEDLRSEICLGELDEGLIDSIEMRLKEELTIESVDLDNVFYICDGIDLKNPQHALMGKLIESFEEIRNEEPNNPNALYRLVAETAQKKASYEMDIVDYTDVLKLKGISRFEFERMLDSHSKKSITGIEHTKKFIDKLSLRNRREYHQALTNLLENDHSHNLNVLKASIFEYIQNNEVEFIDEDEIVNVLSPLFDEAFPLEYR